jgi:gliding motility-associated-like protein
VNSAGKFNQQIEITMIKIFQWMKMAGSVMLLLIIPIMNAAAQDIIAAGGTTTAKYQATVNPGDGTPFSPAAEDYLKTTDNIYNNKYLLFNWANAAANGGAWLKFQCNTPAIVGLYSLTSANDAAARDPRNWTLEGSDDNVNWTTLDTRTNETFTARNQTRVFSISNATAYTYYRLSITANSGDGLFQMAEWRLFEAGAPEAPTNLTIATVSSDEVYLAWTDNSVREANYLIERSTDFSTYTTVATLGNSSTNYFDKGLQAGTTYLYRVSAVNTYGAGSASAGVSTLSSGASLVDITDDGGTLTAKFQSTSNDGSTPYTPVGENYVKITDNNNSTKYLIFAPLNTFQPYWVQYQGVRPYIVSKYTIVTANDAASRDPRNWTFEGSNDGSSWTVLDTKTNQTFGSRTTAYNFVISNSTAYTHYRINVTANNGATNILGQIGEFQIWGSATDAPAAPSNLSASASTASSIDLIWKDNSSNENGFEIGRSINGTSFTVIDTIPANSTSFIGYVSEGLSQNTTYYYRVRALGSSNFSHSVYTNTAQATTKVSLISPPTGAEATALSHTQVRVAWTDNSNDETGFQIEQSLNGTSFTLVKTVAAGVTADTLSGLNPVTKYYYRIRATGTPINSSYTNIVEVTTPVDPAWPLTPSGLSASAATNTEISLTWQDNSNNETGFRIERSLNGTVFTSIDTVNADVVNFNDVGLTHSTKYYYRVQSINASGAYGYTNIADATTLVDPALPVAPTALTATATSHTAINLTWTDPLTSANANNETGFQIERSLNGTAFTLLTTTAADVTAYSDNSLTPTTKYYYRVRAVNGTGNSPTYSNVADATTAADPAVPGTPGNLTVTAMSDSEIYLTWADNSTDEVLFEIERSLNGTAFTLIKTLGADTASYMDIGLTKNTKYYYRVRAKNSVNYSAYSAVKDATTTADVFKVYYDVTNDGGTTTAKYQSITNDGNPYSPPSEDYTKITDNSNSTKYLIFGNPAINFPYYIDYKCFKNTGYIVNRYTIVTANDAENRDPKDWTFEGSDDGETWVVLDTRTNQFNNPIVARSTPVDFTFTNSTAYSYYRFNVSANNGSTNILGQIAELQIWEAQPVAPFYSLSLVATTVSHDQVKLDWKDVADNEVGFEIERSIDSSAYELVHTTGANTTTYTDAGLSPLTKYFYRVRVKGTNSSSAYTHVAWATTKQHPDAPQAMSNVSATGISGSEIQLNWTDNSANESGFEIYQSLNGVTFTLLTTTAAGATSYVDQNLKVARRYYYKVRAVNASGVSQYSKTVSAVTTGANVAPTLDFIADQNICNTPNPQTIALTGISAVEQGQTVTLSVTSNNAAMFTELFVSPITNGQAQLSYTLKPGETGTALVSVTVKDDGEKNNNGNDTFTRTFIINVSPLAVTVTSSAPQFVRRGATIELTASGADTYEWLEGPGILSDNTAPTITVHPTQNFVYKVVGSTSSGCSATAEYIVKMQGDFKIDAGNILTPNGDGKNDSWIVWNINTFPNNEVKVFDTAGRLVFSVKNYGNDWDGTYNGSQLAEGVYYYFIDLGSGIPVAKGTLTLVRE